MSIRVKCRRNETIMVKGKYSNFEMEKELIVQNENP